ncbi:MAG: xylulose kinase [Propionibacteriaceae bacterium]|jgi:xylulokinase|nr:xylulose kinase [Propionibacteriaceae bacterium]
MTLVAGVDSSTQSCKVVVKDAATGSLVRSGRAPHPDGSAVHPDRWWQALAEAAAAAGGLDDCAAIAVAGQQHGLVCLDTDGEVVREALLWNDNRSAAAAEDLIAELGSGDRATGAASWAERCGSVPVASLTVAKLRWLAQHEPANAAKTVACCLPHDWLSWRLAGHGPRSQGGDGAVEALFSDRSDASGTGYYNPSTDQYDRQLLKLASGRDDLLLPAVLGPAQAGGRTRAGALIGPGAGDNAAAALGLGLTPGEVSVSLGTSGVAAAVSARPVTDPSGAVNGFADAAGGYLPLGCTLNAARVLDVAAALLEVDHAGLDQLALAAEPGAGGLVLVPYFEGERTPNKPFATAALHGLTLANLTRANLARAHVEALLCAQADGLDALRRVGVVIKRVHLIGGGARSQAVRRLAAGVLGLPVVAPGAGEHVADGAARQAAWVLAGSAAPPDWPIPGQTLLIGASDPALRRHYAAVRDLVWERTND